MFAACVAVVLLTAFLIPLSIMLYRSARNATRQIEDVKADLKQLIKDSRDLVQNIDQLSSRANRQLDEVDKILRLAREWSERANHVAEEVSSAVEAPIMKVAQGFKMLRESWKLIIGTLIKRNRPAGQDAKEIRGTESPEKPH